MIEHLENSPHGNVTNAFLFLFYSSLSLPYVESPRVMMRVPKIMVPIEASLLMNHFNSMNAGHGHGSLAKPAPVIETFCTDELVSRYVKLDGVVTLVDAKHAMQHLDEVKPRFVVNEAVEQVAYADRIILNKWRNTADPMHNLREEWYGWNEALELKFGLADSKS
ncbi:COBW domain-containing protein 1 [Vitis vinifera]|uniref:COBW domain-containing protein 1 n=1 Tax=Vitis vinifera TaxID=29760 RepID=A0A438GY75_VITVI|nr:COBW domain-containing protein 1 [Vitis vinifera]